MRQRTGSLREDDSTKRLWTVIGVADEFVLQDHDGYCVTISAIGAA